MPEYLPAISSILQPSDVAAQLIDKLSSVVSPEDIKWTVDNCTQVTLLATSILVSLMIAQAKIYILKAIL